MLPRISCFIGSRDDSKCIRCSYIFPRAKPHVASPCQEDVCHSRAIGSHLFARSPNASVAQHHGGTRSLGDRVLWEHHEAVRRRHQELGWNTLCWHELHATEGGGCTGVAGVEQCSRRWVSVCKRRANAVIWSSEVVTNDTKTTLVLVNSHARYQHKT